MLFIILVQGRITEEETDLAPAVQGYNTKRQRYSRREERKTDSWGGGCLLFSRCNFNLTTHNSSLHEPDLFQIFSISICQHWHNRKILAELHFTLLKSDEKKVTWILQLFAVIFFFLLVSFIP